MSNPLRGPAFPFRIDPRSGGVAVSEEDDKIRDNLKHLLLTRPGERVMAREYGGGANELVHENINDGIVALARLQISRAMVTYEPRALPEDVSVIPRDGELYVRVRYIRTDVPRVGTLVIPVA